MCKVNDLNYIQISGWMINSLHLKGNELLVYALIHGFSQDGMSVFSGGVRYISAWLSSTDHTVIAALKSLLAKKLICRRVTETKGSVKHVIYWTAKSRETGENTTAKIAVAAPEKQAHHCKNYSGTTANSTVVTTANFAVNNTNINSSLKTFSSSSSETTENSDAVRNEKTQEKEKPAGIKKIMQGILGVATPFCTERYEHTLENILKQNGLCENEFEPYLRYVWEVCEKKKPENVSSYFRTVAESSITMTNFLLNRKDCVLEEKKSLFRCPVCGCGHSFFDEACPECGLMASEQNDSEVCAVRKKALELPEDERLRLNEELDRAVLETSGGVIDKQSSLNLENWRNLRMRKREIWRKYGLIDDADERNVALFEDGA